MSKKLTIILIALTIILGSGILYVLLGGRAPGGAPIFTGSPFGTPPDDVVPVGEEPRDDFGVGPDGQTPVDESGRPINPLYKLSEGPVAGAVAIVKNNLPYVRYVDRATGHVVDVNPATIERVKVLNTTRPQIYEAMWRSDGLGFVERTVAQNSDTVSNTAITLIPPTGTSTDGLYTARATLLRGDVGEIIVNLDNSLIYNLEDTGAVLTASFGGENPRTLVTLPFTKWRIHKAGTSTPIISTKPSSGALGYAYSLNLSNGALTKILGPLAGLTVLPSLDGRRILYSYTQGSSPTLVALNRDTDLTFDILPASLPEKCVWGRLVRGVIYCGAPISNLGNDVPDLWYQGVTTYSDKVWRFDVDTGIAEVILDPKSGLGIEIDVLNPILSTGEEYLYFINKKDLGLWAIRLLP